MNDTATPFGISLFLTHQFLKWMILPHLLACSVEWVAKKYLFRLKMSHLKQLFLGLCAYNLKQSSETIFFDHRKEHACTPWINPAFSSPIVQDSPRPISPSLHGYLLD